MEAGPLILGRAPLFGDVSCYLLLEREKKLIYIYVYVCICGLGVVDGGGRESRWL